MDAKKAAPERDFRPDVRKMFTVEEAVRALPLVRRIVADVVAQFARHADWDSRFQAASARGPTAGEQADLAAQQRDRCADRLNELAEELAEIGVEIKDWRVGLVDFPCAYEGRVVCLCWKHGEETIGHWHEVEEGYAGRHAIDSAFRSAVRSA